MVIVIRVDIVVRVVLYEDVVEGVRIILIHESTPRWMGAVAWNVWTRASARRVASSSVNRASIDSNRRREMETGERAR